MAKNYLPDVDHVVRHVNSQLVERDPDSGKLLGCFPQAFELRPNEDYLSAYWLEYFRGSKTQRLDQTVNSVAKVRSVKRSHAFCIGNVGDVREACAGFDVRIRVIHEPDEHPAHTALRNYRCDDQQLLTLLAEEAWSEIIGADVYLK
jgi:hypothetical protein